MEYLIKEGDSEEEKRIKMIQKEYGDPLFQSLLIHMGYSICQRTCSTCKYYEESPYVSDSGGYCTITPVVSIPVENNCVCDYFKNKNSDKKQNQEEQQ